MNLNPFAFRLHEVDATKVHPELLLFANESSADIKQLRAQLAREAIEFERAGLGNERFFERLLLIDQFWQNLWEMRLGLFMSCRGDNPERIGDYPDFRITRAARVALVEATSCSRGAQGGKSYLGDRRQAVAVIRGGAAIYLSDDATFRPDHELLADRFAVRMAEKIANHKKRLASNELFKDSPFVIALDIADVDDQFHNGLGALHFYGLNDTCCVSVDPYYLPMISKIESTPLPAPADRSVDVGWLRRYPMVSAVLIGRGWRYEQFKSWTDSDSVFVIENPWATTPLDAEFLPGLRRKNYLERWIQRGALFSTEALESLPADLKDESSFFRKQYVVSGSDYWQLIPLEG